MRSLAFWPITTLSHALDSRLSHRQLLEFELCFHSRAPDSHRHRQRVLDRVDILSLSLPTQRTKALCRTYPDDARFDWMFTCQLLPELQHTSVRSYTKCLELHTSSYPQVSRCPFRSRSNCSLHLSAVRFYFRLFPSTLLLAIPPAQASEPWLGSMHGIHRHTSVRTLDCDSQQRI